MARNTLIPMINTDDQSKGNFNCIDYDVIRVKFNLK